MNRLRKVVRATTAAARGARAKRPVADSPYVSALHPVGPSFAKAGHAKKKRGWKDAAYNPGPEVFARLDRFL